MDSLRARQFPFLSTDHLTMKKIVLSLACASLALALAIASPGPVIQDPASKPTATSDQSDADKKVIADQLPSYPLNVCPISKKKLGGMGKSIDLVVDGHLVRLCCKGCIKKAKANPASVVKQIEAAVIAAQKPTYPSDKCAILGKPLDRAGTPTDVVLGTRLVRVCCNRCAKAARKDPAKPLKSVNADLIKAQIKTYPVTTCVVSGEALESEEMGPPVNILYGTRLVRLCCKMCKRELDKNPAKFIEKLDKAAAKKKKG